MSSSLMNVAFIGVEQPIPDFTTYPRSVTVIILRYVEMIDFVENE